MTSIARLLRPKQAGQGARAPPRRHGQRRIISLSMVKNEQDIIEPFIRHNARFVDCMMILDNASVDGTRRIAMDCARELGNVVVTDDNEFGYLQGERMTRVLRGCQAAFRADYVLFLDADEFIGAADRSALVGILDRIPSGGVGLMPWRNFILTREEAAAAPSDAPRSMRHRRVKDGRIFFKAVLRLDGTERPDLVVAQGNHDIETTSGDVLPHIGLDDLPLLHFPIRSREQLMTKTIVGWVAYVAKDPDARRAADGLQWRDAFDRIVAGAISADELSDLSLRYGQPPMDIDWSTDVAAADPPTDYVRKYGPAAPGDPLAVIARSWERSLSQPAARLGIVRPAAAEGTALWDDLAINVAPFRFIVEKESPASVVDFGCGVGACLALCKQLGAGVVVGVDTIPCGAVALAEDEYVADDKWRPIDLGRSFDLVFCTAGAEPRASADIDVLIDNAIRHAGVAIVLSSGGPRHPAAANAVAPPIAGWLARLASRGWFPDLVDSLGMRALADLPWLRRRLVVLRRGDRAAGEAAIAVLGRLDAAPAVPSPARPGIVPYAFTEDGTGGLNRP